MNMDPESKIKYVKWHFIILPFSISYSSVTYSRHKSKMKIKMLDKMYEYI